MPRDRTPTVCGTARYKDEDPVILRVPTDALPDGLEFSRYNSGSPRWSRGEPSPRGHTTFRRAKECDFVVGRIVEVTVPGAVALPSSTECGPSPSGPWTSLFTTVAV